MEALFNLESFKAQGTCNYLPVLGHDPSPVLGRERPEGGTPVLLPVLRSDVAPHGGWLALCSPSRGPPAPQSRPAASGRAGRSALPGAL